MERRITKKEKNDVKDGIETQEVNNRTREVC
jgi:hypothetical protein